MDIVFMDGKFAKECRDQKLLIRRHGQHRAKLIGRRLDELRAAESLMIMRSLPGARCHELKGNRLGQLSVDLDHPYRLIFLSNHNPLRTRPDGGLDWSQVTSIEIIGVEDTHE